MSYFKRVVTLYLPSGTTVKVPYVPDALTFEEGGMQIRNPFLSDCGRFEVSPKEYGFVEYTTGGGNMALMKQLPHGKYMLLTDEDGTSIPETSEWKTALLGVYNGNGEPIVSVCMGDVPMDS